MKKIIVCVVLLILSSTISSCVAKSDREVNVEPINNEELKEQIKEELKQELLREEKEALIIPDKPSSEEIEERAVLRNKIQEVNSELERIKKQEELKAKRELELQKLEEPQINSPLFPEQNSVVINTESSNLTLRSEASTNSKALSSIPKNTKVNYNKTKQIDNYTWYNVEYGGKEGWIRGDYVRPN